MCVGCETSLKIQNEERLEALNAPEASHDAWREREATLQYLAFYVSIFRRKTSGDPVKAAIAEAAIALIENIGQEITNGSHIEFLNDMQKH